MKYIQYLLIVLSALVISSCSKDSTESISPERKAFIEINAIGIYKNNSPLFTFDKNAHQLLIMPSENTIRIQDDAGVRFASLVLEAMPELNSKTGVSGSFKSNFGVPSMDIDNIILIRKGGGMVWLWSEKTLTGMVLPWIE